MGMYIIILSKHTSQRRYKLKYVQSYYYEWKAMGCHRMTASAYGTVTG